MIPPPIFQVIAEALTRPYMRELAQGVPGA